MAAYKRSIPYKTLFTKPVNRCCLDDCSVFNQEFPQLKSQEKAACEAPITIEELGLALKQLPNNKSPGSDGFTSEFYKNFWPELKSIIFENVQYAFQGEMISLDQRRSLLTLLPKPGKDTQLLDNWRPLSLLNTDYKIVAKLLSIRLQNVIDTLVSEDQVGYIKGRQLGDNCRKILDVFEFSEDLHDPDMYYFLTSRKLLTLYPEIFCTKLCKLLTSVTHF